MSCISEDSVCRSLIGNQRTQPLHDDKTRSLALMFPGWTASLANLIISSLLSSKEGFVCWGRGTTLMGSLALINGPDYMLIAR